MPSPWKDHVHEGEPDRGAFVPVPRNKTRNPRAGMQKGSRGEGDGNDLQGGRDASSMAGSGNTGNPVKGKKRIIKRRDPEWASGLKQLYDSVIEEPIPDTFKDLLSKLDDGDR